MKLLKTMIFGLLIGFPALVHAQTNSEKVDELKSVLKQSLYKSEVNIDEKNNVSRVDNNGYKFNFNLSDVLEIKYDFDGFHNVLILMKEGKTVEVVFAGNKTEYKLNVLAFHNQTDCDKAIELLKQLIE